MFEPLVLLPDMMCDARLFQSVISEFSATRTIIIPNFGSEPTIELMANSVLQALPERFALIGAGLRGAIAMDIVRRDPKRVSHLALMSCSPLAETPQTAASRESKIIGAKIGRLDEVVREELQTGLLAPSDRKLAHQNLLVDMAVSLGSEVYVTQARALQRRLDQQATLRRLRLPSAVICGAQDEMFPLKRQEFMAELIPHASFHVIETSGHFPTLEAPEEVNGILSSLLTKQDAAVQA